MPACPNALAGELAADGATQGLDGPAFSERMSVQRVALSSTLKSLAGQLREPDMLHPVIL